MTVIGYNRLIDFFVSDRVGGIIFIVLMFLFIATIITLMSINVFVAYEQGIQTYNKFIEMCYASM